VTEIPKGLRFAGKSIEAIGGRLYLDDAAFGVD